VRLSFKIVKVLQQHHSCWKNRQLSRRNRPTRFMTLRAARAGSRSERCGERAVGLVPLEPRVDLANRLSRPDLLQAGATREHRGARARPAGAGARRWSSRSIGLPTSRDEAQWAAGPCSQRQLSPAADTRLFKPLDGNVPQRSSNGVIRSPHRRGRAAWAEFRCLAPSRSSG
jgi:hypothetical protein